jgi:ADP-heptose:LPS heptosyltransferase
VRTTYPVEPGIRNILALRPNAVGDFVFALPALHALRHTYPEARIVFIGKTWHAAFLHERPGPVDEVIVMPPVPGVGAPLDASCDAEAERRFVECMRGEAFDLAIQMYGGGRYSNPFINRLGARMTIGLKTPEAEPLDRWLPYGDFVNRRLELLQLAALVGAAPPLLERELEVIERDRREAVELLPPTPGERIVLLHPGASDVRRHWPAERFAEVGDALANSGATIVISATESERPLAGTIVERMRHPVVDLTGRMTLSGLCGMLERAVMMVSNDTGPLHLAFALNTPAVGIYWLTNVLEASPLKPVLLRAAMSARTHCLVCGQENRKSRCAHDVCFVDDVTTEEVMALALELYAQVA